MKIKTLMRYARASARYKGHDMKKFVWRSSTRCFSKCKVCGASMEVNSNTAPNEIDIGGKAVAINCVGKKK